MEAALQGGVTTVLVDGRTYGSYNAGRTEDYVAPDWDMMWIGGAVLVFGIVAMIGAVMWTHTRCRSCSSGRSLNEPLIAEEEMF